MNDKEQYLIYVQMRDDGGEATEIYLAAKANGLSEMDCLIVLKQVFAISAVEAKEVSIKADNPNTTLADHQANIIEPLQQAIEEFLEDND